MIGGIIKMGAGSTARVAAVSFSAFLAAIFETPTTVPSFVVTSMPVLNSFILMSTTLQTLAQAAHEQENYYNQQIDPATPGNIQITWPNAKKSL